MVRPQVTDEMLERARAEIKEAQHAAIEKHSRGAFRSVRELEKAIERQLRQLNGSEDENNPGYINRKEYAKQLAQIGQLAEFGLASVETWED
jgi:tRNA(Ser,Leu) C12 N-acetylase TAN1